jgi:hypothetical protein
VLYEPDEIEPVLIDLLKRNLTYLKLVDLHEPEFNEQEIGKLLSFAPFSLVICDVELPEFQTGGSLRTGMIHQEYNILVGSRSLRTKAESFAGVRNILHDQRVLLDGKPITIDGAPTASFTWAGNFFEFSQQGLITFSQRYQIYQV